MNVLFLNLSAPLMSFGTTQVDSVGPTDLFPCKSLLVGMIANALGLKRNEFDKHISLQNRISYAVRIDRAGTTLTDFQTTDLSLSHMLNSNAWTTEGKLETRGGGNGKGIDIRQREYIQDSVVTVAVTIQEEDNQMSFDDIVSAIVSPERPLFIGRKTCIPTELVFNGTTVSDSLEIAITSKPRHARSDEGGLLALIPRTTEAPTDHSLTFRVENKDWENNLHVGRRFYIQKTINPPSVINETISN